jgi:DNA-binding transcriptional LysR family regulator
MDLLHALATFVQVAETGSFSAVARESRSSQPGVSRVIERLERHFASRLLHRTTRSLTLTEEGESLLSHARELLAAAEEMETALRRRQASPTGPVRVGVASDTAMPVASRLAELLRRHPALSVELIVAERFGDMVQERLDLVVQTGEPQAASAVARVIASFRRAVVAAPAYLDEHGMPADPSELAQHRCIVHEAGPDSDRWKFAGPDGPIDVRVAGPLQANSAAVVRHAALAGQGIAYLSEALVADDIRANRLCRLLPETCADREQLFVVYPSRRHMPPRTRVLIDFLVELGREAEARFARGDRPDDAARGPRMRDLIAA